MKKKQATRERIFRNNRVELNENEKHHYAKSEILRQALKYNFSIDSEAIVAVDVDDPFMSVGYLSPSPHISGRGYSKRMPNDIPNDRIAIQVAVSRLIKRLKNG